MYDEVEEDRLEHIQIAKSRGKGAPKKKKSAAGEFRALLFAWMVLGRVMLTAVKKAGRNPGRSGSGMEIGLYDCCDPTGALCALGVRCTDALGGVLELERYHGVGFLTAPLLFPFTRVLRIHAGKVTIHPTLVSVPTGLPEKYDRKSVVIALNGIHLRSAPPLVTGFASSGNGRFHC